MITVSAVNEVEITEIRLQNVKNNVVMASFYCLVTKIWKKIVFYNIAFFIRFEIKYTYVFQRVKTIANNDTSVF